MPRSRRPDPRARRGHRDLGLHVRPGAEGGRRLPALRLPRRALRDLDGSCSPRSRGRPLRTLPRAGWAAGALAGGFLAAAYALPDGRARPDDGLEHRVHHRPLRRLHADPRARALPDAGPGRRLGRRRALARRPRPDQRHARRLRRSGTRSCSANAVAQSFQIVAMERFAPRYDARALDVPPDGRLVRRVHRDRARARASSRCPTTRRRGTRSSSPACSPARSATSSRPGCSRATTAARAALVFTLEAPFAALFGVLLLSERLGWAGWAGCAVMLAGILLAEPAAAARRCGASSRRGRSGRRRPRALLGGALRRDAGRRAVRARPPLGRPPSARCSCRRRRSRVARASRPSSRAASRSMACCRSCSPARSRRGSRRPLHHPRDPRGGLVAGVGRVRDGAALRRHDRGRRVRRAAGTARCSLGALLIVAGGIVLAQRVRAARSTCGAIGIVFALVGARALRAPRHPRAPPVARDRRSRR